MTFLKTWKTSVYAAFRKKSQYLLEFETFLRIFLLDLMESYLLCISLSCSPADETDSGHKDDDQGMLKNLIPPFITVFVELLSTVFFP